MYTYNATRSHLSLIIMVIAQRTGGVEACNLLQSVNYAAMNCVELYRPISKVKRKRLQIKCNVIFDRIIVI